MHLSETALLLMLLLATGVLVRGLFARLPVPYTVMLVIVGMLLGKLAVVWPLLSPLQDFHLSPELVLFIFLPALIFESGFSLNTRQLVKDIIPVLVLAVPALLLSTTIVGLGVWYLLPLGLTTALLFGALISATDPVAVISLFKELGTPLRLTILVEGESLFNDATAIVVFTILLGLTLHSGFESSDIGVAVVQFIRVFFGGALAGLLFGLVIGWLAIRLNLHISGVLVVSVILAYVSFIVAEHNLHLSGVMAVVSGAIGFNLYAKPRLSTEAGHALHITWEFLADIINTLLFILIGMSVDLQNLLDASGYILLVSLLIIAARACSVYSFVPLTVKLFKLPEITLGERHIMCWGGLKGGLAIAIVLSIPADLPGRELLLNLTLGVVLFSLLVNAPTIRPLIKKLGLDAFSEDEAAELNQAVKQIDHNSDEMLDKFVSSQILSKAGHYLTQRDLQQSLQWTVVEISLESLHRKQQLNALREESIELESLFNAGVIPQYCFLDIKAELQRKRDHVINPHRVVNERSARQANLFRRFESALLRRLRESDYFTAILVRYQNMRLSQQIVKDLARLLMTEAALDYIQQSARSDPDFNTKLLPHYRGRLQALHGYVAEYQRDFSDLYQSFETRFAKRAAMVSVLREIENEHLKGSIGAKVYATLEQTIRHALAQIPTLEKHFPGLEKRELIGLVPLFSGLSDKALQGLADTVSSVNFLAGDVIIAEGERGDALYIVVKGRVRVTQAGDHNKHALADLGEGDFFGEMALLGDQKRKATVTAVYASTLLRLTAAEVMALSASYPEIGEYLNKLKQARETEPR